jgi:modulator of FtsH protease HflC
MQKSLPVIIIFALLAIVTVALSAYTVDQREAAIRFRFGEAIATETTPGLKFRMPFLDTVKTFDMRIQTLDTKDAERIQTKEKNNVLVDSFVKYRIVDVNKFFVSTNGDLARAEIRLLQSVNDDLRAEFGQRTLSEVVSGERDRIMENLREKTDKDARSIGIAVLDVRLKRVDLVKEISNDVYRRMESERKRAASELKSTGAGEAEKIRAEAERARDITVANAFRDAQKIKGEGDAAAARIYADAFSKNPEFASFYRSMEAYEKSFRNKSDVLVLAPDSDFLKYMKSSGTAAKKGK